MLPKFRRVGAFIFIVSLIFTTACGDKELVKNIDTFQKGITETTTAIGIYYAELNEFERELYLFERRYDASLEVLAKDSSGKPTALVGLTFSAEGIKARTTAISILGTYGKRLAALAGTEAPDQFASGTKLLGENLTTLGATFGSLTNDSTAQKYTAPLGALGTIVGTVGQMVMENKRDEALREAVKNAAPNVDQIINLLEDDLKVVIGTQRLLGTKQQLATVVDFYNANRATLSMEARKKALDDIANAQAKYDIAVAFNPSDLLGSLRDAHAALVKYASSGRKVGNLLELVNALDAFHERAEVILNAVKQLRELRRNS